MRQKYNLIKIIILCPFTLYGPVSDNCRKCSSPKVSLSILTPEEAILTRLRLLLAVLRLSWLNLWPADLRAADPRELMVATITPSTRANRTKQKVSPSLTHKD